MVGTVEDEMEIHLLWRREMDIHYCPSLQGPGIGSKAHLPVECKAH